LENQKKKNHLGGPRVNERIILTRLLKEIGCAYVDWMLLAVIWSSGRLFCSW